MVVHFYLTVSQPVDCARRPTRRMATPEGAEGAVDMSGRR